MCCGPFKRDSIFLRIFIKVPENRERSESTPSLLPSYVWINGGTSAVIRLILNTETTIIVINYHHLFISSGVWIKPEENLQTCRVSPEQHNYL